MAAQETTNFKLLLLLVLFSLLSLQVTSSLAGSNLLQAPIPQNKIAFIRGGDIWLMNPDGTQQENLTKSLQIEDNPSWSPDGKKIAFNRGVRPGSLEGNQIYELDLATRQITPLTGLRNEEAISPSYTPDGTGIVSQSFFTKGIPDEITGEPLLHYKWSLNILNLKTKKKTVIRASNFLYEASEFDNPFMPNRQEIYYGWSAETFAGINKINLKTKAVTSVYYPDIAGSKDMFYSLAFSKNNLAAGLIDIYGSPRLFVRNVTTKSTRYYRNLDYSNLTPQAFSPDNNVLALTVTPPAEDPTEELIDSIWVLQIGAKSPRKIADNASKAAWQPPLSLP